MTDSSINREAVLSALSHVMEPELHRDLVSLNMIRDLTVEGKTVSFTIRLTTPACPMRGKIQADAKQAVMALPGVEDIVIKMDAMVIPDGKIQEVLNLPIGNAVAIASGKGGVGKTTVAVNTAVALAQSGARVGLLDADIYGPNVPIMMGVKELPPAKNGKMTPAVVYGVKIMSIGFMVKPGQPIIWRGPMLHTAIRQFLNDVAWGDLDYLIIDLPPGTGDAQLSLSQSIPLSGGVIVTLPQQVSLEDASRGLYMFRQLNVPVLGVVENMSYLEMPDGSQMDIFGSGGGRLLSDMAGVPYLGEIPLDPTVRMGGDKGVPVVVSHPESNSARALRSVAEKIAAGLSVAAVQAAGTVNPQQTG